MSAWSLGFIECQLPRQFLIQPVASHILASGDAGTRIADKPVVLPNRYLFKTDIALQLYGCFIEKFALAGIDFRWDLQFACFEEVPILEQHILPVSHCLYSI